MGHPYQIDERVVFQVEDQNFVGHMCGRHGDQLSIESGKVIRNGTASDCGKGLRRQPELDIPETSVNDEGFVFIVNNGSFDSTRVGSFSADVIRGKVSFVFRDAPGGRRIGFNLCAF
jgi:hypothetical protein